VMEDEVEEQNLLKKQGETALEDDTIGGTG
jgi:hypothetical protein